MNDTSHCGEKRPCRIDLQGPFLFDQSAALLIFRLPGERPKISIASAIHPWKLAGKMETFFVLRGW